MALPALVPVYLLVVRAAAAITPYLYEAVVGGAAAGAAVKGTPLLANAVAKGTRSAPVGAAATVTLGKQMFSTGGGTTVTAVGRAGSQVASHWVVESADRALLEVLAARLRSCSTSGGCGEILTASVNKFRDLVHLPAGMSEEIATALRNDMPMPGGDFPNIFIKFDPTR